MARSAIARHARREGQYELHRAIFLNQPAGLHQAWHVVRDFAGAAAGQERDDRLTRIQTIGGRKFRARSRCRYVSYQAGGR